MNSKRLSELRYKGHITNSEYWELKNTIEALENKKPHGEWKLVERFNFIDIVCPYCNNVRFPSYAYGFSIEEVKEHLKSEKLPAYCENCGAVLRKWDVNDG